MHPEAGGYGQSQFCANEKYYDQMTSSGRNKTIIFHEGLVKNELRRGHLIMESPLLVWGHHVTLWVTLVMSMDLLGSLSRDGVPTEEFSFKARGWPASSFEPKPQQIQNTGMPGTD